MLSRLSGLANTVLHELSGDAEGSENAQVSDPVAESSTGEKMSEDQMETLAHYEQLVIQLKELIQQKDAEIQQKNTELQQKETQHKLEKEASDAKITKLKLQAKAKLTTLNKQIEELKKTALSQVNTDGNRDAISAGQKETLQSAQNNEESTSKLQENINELTRQLHDSQKNVSELTKQVSENQEAIATLNHQLQDSQETVSDLRKALQESGDAARELHKKQETEIRHLQRKLEEQDEALSSRTQVVQMLEQELQNAELQKQVLAEQYREMEHELLLQKEGAQKTIQEKDNVYQILKEELDKEKSFNSQLESLRAEAERGIQAQDELEQVKKDLEMEQEARKQIEEARQQLDIKIQDMEQLRVQLEREVKEELETLRAELDREKEAREELEQQRSHLEEQKRSQEEVQAKSRETDEEVQQLRAELDERKEAQEQLKIELEQLKSNNELLMEKMRVNQQNVEIFTNETDHLSTQLEHVRSDLKNGKESQEELSRLREELQRVQESLVDLDHVKNELEKGQETLLKLDLMKQELQKLREAEIMVDTLQQEIDQHKLEKGKEDPQEVSGTDTGINRDEFTQCKMIISKDAVNAKEIIETDGQSEGDKAVDAKETTEMNELNDCDRDKAQNANEKSEITINVKEELETDGQNNVQASEELHQVPDTSSKTQFKEEFLDIHTQSLAEEHLQSVNVQLQQSSLVKVQSHSVYQELAVDVAMEDLKEKQLSILMMDLVDTQEEINMLKGQLKMETMPTENLEESSDFDIRSLKEQVKELKYQLEKVSFERDSITVKLQSLVQSQKPAESISQFGLDSSGLQKQHYSDFESQNILAEQVISLENESKSKDLKIIALQKDLDNMNLLLSEQNGVIKLQGNQLDEKSRNLESLQEVLILGQGKEERLSEALAANEREIFSLQEQLSKKTTEKEFLQHSLDEKENQIAEVSHSLSDKVVLLNEEKFSMVKEIKALKEQLSSIIQQSGKEEESLETLRIANAELNLQKEMLTQEKSGLQEMLESIQMELGEVKSQLENASSSYIHSQEILKSVEEEREMLHAQLEEQRSKCLFKQNQLEELQTQVENHRHNYEQQQLLIEKHQSSLNDIIFLQEEKSKLEQQLKYFMDRQPEDDGKAGLKVKEELHIKAEHQKKEIEQLKRKLQAALVSRKELSKKVSKLEEDLVKHKAEKVLDPEETSGMQNSNLKSDQQALPNDELLKTQLLRLESELEHVRRELTEKDAANDQLQILINELRDKCRHAETLASEQNDVPKYEKPDSSSNQINVEEKDNIVLQLENRVMQLEQDKVNLHKKVQEALNSRRDTIKKSQEKDRHHREQLKQQKEEFNLLHEKLERLQMDQKSDSDTDRICEEQAIQTEIPYPVEKPSVDSPHGAEEILPVCASQDSSEKSNWGEEWVDFLPEKVENALVHISSTDTTLDSYKMQLELFQSEKRELEVKSLQLQEKLNESLDKVSHLHDTIDHLSSQLEQEKDKCHVLETQVSDLKTELEKSKQELSSLQEFTIKNIEDELTTKKEEIGQLHQELEDRTTALRNANELISEKENLILSLKSQMEFQTKEYEEHCKILEVKIQEVQQKQDDDLEEEKGKQQLQRKLQAALISRKDALKESKALKLDLETLRKQKEDLANRLQVAGQSVSEIHLEKETLLKTLSAQKEERDKLIMELDKCLLENQNLEASCESLKSALVGITQDKEDLNKELESLKTSHDSKTSDWQDKLSDLQKEYEILLQSYENVSDETDRMKRAVEMVKKEKQELFTKMKSVEGERRDLENQLEESQQEIENMKEKMRKFAKSKQQKILELEEENDRLRRKMDQATEVQKSADLQENDAIDKDELTKSQTENSALKLELELVKSEKENLTKEMETLKLQLDSVELDLQKVLEERSMETLEKEVISKTEAIELSHPIPGCNNELVSEKMAASEVVTDNDEKQETNLEKISQLELIIEKLESGLKAKENEVEELNKAKNVFQEEKLHLESLLNNSQDINIKIEKDLADLEKKYQMVVNDLDKANEQKHTLEVEKDELEERLMNQMAELNGSIGNFQQDAVDLQINNESLQRELEDLRLRLEEERRQMERQKAEALSEVHKEYVEKLKSVHQGEKGKKTQLNELQELLKEKQQEVRQLQKDCIQYQETISRLERTFKALEFVHSECEKEKVVSSDRVAKAVADTKKAQADLTSLRVLLDDTQSEAARVLAENVKIKKEIRLVTENTVFTLKRKEEELEKKLEEERMKHLKEMANLHAKILLLQQDKEQFEGSIKSLQGRLDEKSQEIKDLQGNLNQNLAKLAAFTHSMCSLQDDRDRVIEESKKWNEKFSDELQKKDDEINDKERTCMDLKNELQLVTSQVDELKAHIGRLQLENEELIITKQTEADNLSKERDSLLEEKAFLSSSLEEEQKMHLACQEDLKLHIQEAKDRLSQLEALNIEVTQFQKEKEDLLQTIQRLEAEVQDLKLHNEQTQSDLQASKSLTEQLHKELEQKEEDVVRLLSSRDEAVSSAVGELNELHTIQCKALEERLEEAEKDRKHMQDKLEELKTQLIANQEEADRSKAQLQAFTKSMCSLQDERERLFSDYQQLEQRHLDAILAKDGLIQEAAAESNKLREELRFLRSRTDDLNAQNAKLNAQLARYREDLNEVISLKDSQLKQLLGEKLQEIEKLRSEQNNQELLLNHEKGQKDALQQELDETKKEKEISLEKVDSLTHSITKLQTENEAFKNQLKQEEEKVQMLKDELLQVQKDLEIIKEEAVHIQAEAEKRVQRAEDDLNKKLQSIQHDTGILRNETETAEERVAELARDLMDAEQRLLNVNEENASLKAQMQAFGGSMRSLQDSHDLAQEEIKNLQEQLNEVLALNEDLSSVKTERDNLSLMFSESKEEQQRIQIQLKEVMSSLKVREEEIRRVTADFQASQMQLRNMSKAMGSLQEDRDRLQSSLKTPPREIERTLQSSYQRENKISNDHSKSSQLKDLQNTHAEMQNLRTELSDTLAQVQHKELQIQELNIKFSQLLEEKSSLSHQLQDSNQTLRDANNRCSSLERQLHEIHPKNSALTSDSAPGAPQEKQEPQTEADRQLLELQQRYLELKQQSTEHEHVRSVLEQQLREERQRAEYRIQELEENINRLGSQDWSVHEDPVAPHELSLLVEPPDAPNVKTRSSSLKRLLRLIFCSRTKTPLLVSLYFLLIHALLFLCLTGHL
ncbi:golgin subfamily B member 1 [Pyxicephalus adspersus]|uniref:golgin subfamily B member 1 n=1 Tax=Pyxicephalus adspersus TaxID=30357 RepID=UPI003B5C06CC